MSENVKRGNAEKRKPSLPNLRILVVACLAACLIAAASVARCTSIHAEDRQPEAGQEQEQDQGQGEEDAGEDSQAQTAELTVEQKAVHEAYNETQEEVCALLAANCWTADEESSAIDFTDCSFTETGKSTRPFVICHVEEDQDEGDAELGHYTSTTLNCVILLSDGAYENLRVEESANTDAGSKALAVSSECFENNEMYERSKAATEFTLQGADENLTSHIGGKQQDLANQLRDYCSINYPTASSATWNRALSIDYVSGVLETAFELDNSAGTELAVAYDLERQTFAIEGGE